MSDHQNDQKLTSANQVLVESQGYLTQGVSQSFSYSITSIKDLLARLTGEYSQEHLQLIRKAYDFSKKAHEGQYRKSGEAFILHPLSVSAILAELNLDPASIATGLLHDTVEDTSVTLQDITQHFGEEIAHLVDGVTKISKLTFYTNTHSKQGENIRKMFVAMAKDMRVVVVKLADRLHNMRTLNHMPYEKQLNISQETLDIYAPLSHRLGISAWQVELEDLSFKYLKPNNYQDLSQKFSDTKKEKKQFIKDTTQTLFQEIKKQTKLTPIVQGRHKHLYSIYQKMSRKNVDYDAIYDVFGFRVITDTKTQCYEILGIMHSLYHPIPGRFKDYIAIPKANHYQSLHTTVMSSQGDRIEIQIRTKKMHLIAEKGIAAHWTYKSGQKIASTIGTSERFEWMKNLMDWNKETYDPSEFLENIKSDLLQSEIYIFTPKGDVRALRKGATALDFAYLIHTEIGHHTIGAKIDGQIVPIKHQLQNGDTVQIMTASHQKPSKDWLQYCITTSARSKIRNFIRTEEGKKSIDLGHQLLEKEFKKHGFKLDKYINTEQSKKYLESIGIKTKENLYSQIAYGKHTPNKIFIKLNPDFQKETKKPVLKSLLDKVYNKDKKRKDRSLIKVDGMTDMLLHYAKCCQPIPGDPIVGFISRNRGLVIHQRSCSKNFEVDPERKVDVEWMDVPHAKHITRLRVVCHDYPGLLKIVSETFTLKGINIEEAQVKTQKNKKTICIFTVSVTDKFQLLQALKSLEKVNGVIHAERTFYES